MEGKITVFIVEDDEALAKELKSYLMRWNYDAVVAKEFERISEEFQDCRPHIVSSQTHECAPQPHHILNSKIIKT